jgi:hypothetical protein
LRISPACGHPTYFRTVSHGLPVDLASAIKNITPNCKPLTFSKSILASWRR